MDPQMTPDPTGLYTGKARFYHHRANYSPECMDFLLQQAGIRSDSVIADIGAGTGTVTRQLLERTDCAIVLAEPNGDMLSRARREIVSPRVTFLQTPAEDTGIPDRSVDLVVVGTAFHWFDGEKFREECLRICKPGGKVALLRLYNFVPDIHAGNTSTDHSIRTGADRANRFFRGGKLEEKLFFHEEMFDFPRFLGERLSDHKAPNPEDPGYDRFVREAREAFDYFGADSISNVFITSCLLGDFGP